ncbi:MAG: type II secretion system F family protein [Nanoarchaeota archaeon]|nr:type II secretion system F family protein [Nanoarchaeota archaeon]
MFEDLKKNLEQERRILVDLRSIQASIEYSLSDEQFYSSAIDSLLKQLKLLNKAIPELLKEGSPINKFSDNNSQKEEKSKIIKLSYVSPSTKEKRYVTINEADKKEFLEKLKLSEGMIKGIKNAKKEESVASIQKPLFYAQISNKYFRRLSEKLVPQIGSMATDLKKANIRFLAPTYISMIIMSMFLAIIASALIFFALMIINPNNWIYFWVIVLLPSVTAMIFYTYPASEAKSVDKQINQEIPFATIHMAAIASSDIEPTKIFRIIAMSKEYIAIGKEARKIISQVEVYGYDLVTSLKNVASRTSNKQLSELLSGLATNISTGGSLKSYLEKKAENFLLDYKLERQNYSNLAETFMDVYISILIAAPLVLMMMFIVMNVAGLGLGGISITALLFISIAAVVVINIIFLIVLNFKQPHV